MSNNIVPFEFGGEQIRPATLNGKPALVLADIAKVLGYRDAANAGRILRDHHRGYSEVSTPSGTQNMVVVTEQGFNRLVIRSNASNAEEVQDFITDEVMPQLTRTGSYQTQAAIPSGPELLALAVIEAQGMIAAQGEQIAALAPKADAWDGLASGDGTYAVADAAKMLGQVGIDTGRDRLFEFMHGRGWLYRSGGRWQAKQTAVDAKRVFHKPQSHKHPETGELVLDAPQVRVTMKGLNELRMLMLTPIAA